MIQLFLDLFLGALPKGRIKILKNLQKKCVKNVAGTHPYASHERFEKLGFFDFDELFHFTCTKFMSKCRLRLLPESIGNLFQQLSFPNRTCGFVTKQSKSKAMEMFPSHFLPRIWNSNSLMIKTSATIGQFNRSYRMGRSSRC